MKLFAKAFPAAAILLTFLAPVAHAADKDMKAMMMKGHEKMMSMQMSGKPDVDFAMAMREHHMGAVEMAQWQIDQGKDAKMKQMARKIIGDQKKEIALFDQFLAKNGHGDAKGKGHAGHAPSK